MALNPVTNRIYVVNYGSGTGVGTMAVINGNIDAVIATVNLPSGSANNSRPNSVSVNPVTNKIYTANSADGSVSVIDGQPMRPRGSLWD